MIGYLLMAAGFYLGIGFIFSLIFLWKGLTKVDKSAENTGFFFKALIFPGLLIFWPVFIKKWKQAS